MTWDAYNRRTTALREVLTIMDRRRDLTANDLLNRVDPSREAFETEDQLLLAAQFAWFQRLSGALDRSVEGAATTPEASASGAWIGLAAEMPGARALLDAHLDSPALAKGLANEQIMMAAVSGVPMHHPDAAAHGERIIAAARAKAIYPVIADTDSTSTDAAGGFTGLVSRLRSALAA